jgi:hypothetical protein
MCFEFLQSLYYLYLIFHVLTQAPIANSSDQLTYSNNNYLSFPLVSIHMVLLSVIFIQVSLCVKRLVYTNDKGEIVKGVCSNFLCKDAAYSSEKKKYIKKSFFVSQILKKHCPSFWCLM